MQIKWKLKNPPTNKNLRGKVSINCSHQSPVAFLTFFPFYPTIAIIMTTRTIVRGKTANNYRSNYNNNSSESNNNNIIRSLRKARVFFHALKAAATLYIFFISVTVVIVKVLSTTEVGGFLFLLLLLLVVNCSIVVGNIGSIHKFYSLWESLIYCRHNLFMPPLRKINRKNGGNKSKRYIQLFMSEMYF